MCKRSCMLAVMVVAVGFTNAATCFASGLSEASATAIHEARRKAIQTILAASVSEDPFIRANAIEAAALLDDTRLGALVKLGLEDDEAVVQFAALLTIGNERLKEHAGSAKRFLESDSGSVRAAAMFAMHACGKKVDLSPMARLLASDDPGVRSNAALLLGRMSDRSAVPLLAAMSRRPMRRVSAARAAVVRLQFAEAMVKLGDDKGLDALRSGAYSQFDEVRIVAIKSMGEVGDEAMMPALRELLKDDRQPIQIRLAAAESLARLRQADGMKVVLEGLVSTEPTVRVQAALAGSKLASDGVVLAVVNQLDDANEAAKVAAAAAVLAIAADGS